MDRTLPEPCCTVSAVAGCRGVVVEGGKGGLGQVGSEGLVAISTAFASPFPPDSKLLSALSFDCSVVDLWSLTADFSRLFKILRLFVVVVAFPFSVVARFPASPSCVPSEMGLAACCIVFSPASLDFSAAVLVAFSVVLLLVVVMLSLLPVLALLLLNSPSLLLLR